MNKKTTKISQKFWEELPPVPWGLPEPFMASQHIGQHPGLIYPSLQLALPLSPQKWMGKNTPSSPTMPTVITSRRLGFHF